MYETPGAMRASGLAALTTQASLEDSVNRADRAITAFNAEVAGGSMLNPYRCPESRIVQFALDCSPANILAKVYRPDYYEQARAALAQLATPPSDNAWLVRLTYIRAVRLWTTLAYQAASLRKPWAKPSAASVAPFRVNPVTLGVEFPTTSFSIHCAGSGCRWDHSPMDAIWANFVGSDGSGTDHVLLWSDAVSVLSERQSGEDANDRGAWHSEILRRLDARAAATGPDTRRFGWAHVLESDSSSAVDVLCNSYCYYQNTPCLAADGCYHVYACSRKAQLPSGRMMLNHAAAWAQFVAARSLDVFIVDNGSAWYEYLRPFAARGEWELSPEQISNRMSELARTRASVIGGAATGAAGAAAIVSAPAGALLAAGVALYTLLTRVLPMAAGWSCPTPMFVRTLTGDCSTELAAGGAARALQRGATMTASVAKFLAPVQAAPPAPPDLTPGQKVGIAAGAATVGLALLYVVLK